MSTLKEGKYRLSEYLQRIDYDECPRNQNWLREEVRTVKMIDNEGEWFCFDEVGL